MVRLVRFLVAMVVAAALLVAVTAVVRASGEGAWAPQIAQVQLRHNGTPLWNATIRYTPTFVVNNGSVFVTFFGQLNSSAAPKDCLDAAGGDSCAARWRYPETHITSATVAFDTGRVTRASGEHYFPIPPGATRITGLELTLGDAVHDVGDGSSMSAMVSFGDAFNLTNGSRVASGGSTGAAGGGPEQVPSKIPAGWLAAAAAALVAALAGARRLRARRNTAADIVNEPLGEAPYDGPPLPKHVELPDVTTFPKYDTPKPASPQTIPKATAPSTAAARDVLPQLDEGWRGDDGRIIPGTSGAAPTEDDRKAIAHAIAETAAEKEARIKALELAKKLGIDPLAGPPPDADAQPTGGAPAMSGGVGSGGQGKPATEMRAKGRRILGMENAPVPSVEIKHADVEELLRKLRAEEGVLPTVADPPPFVPTTPPGGEAPAAPASGAKDKSADHLPESVVEDLGKTNFPT